ncbi:MAG: hypothetical protein EOO50_07595 [Flavobacterium sp.]|uniref:YciI family protein n=1 Tax=Flavobacterium sp. TaxID=239 RepID=UPI001218E500|nr:YciI family protein [Flavobacterium sp.]RZJ66911.1 MAG: hypothetical protein EOO50_07595 [Flavobacterium sp.]
MKALFTFLIVVGGIALLQAQDNPNYDKALAEKLGGDEYGMKKYVLAILKTGSNKTSDEKTTNELFRGHMDNIGRLVKEGKLIVAGPLGKNDKTYRGIFIFNVATIAEAQQLVATDPAIKEKLLEVELFEWYGGAALPEYLKVQDKITLKGH